MIQRILAGLGLIAVAASAALAGEHFSCKASAQDCLEMMSAKLKDSGWVGIEFRPEDFQVTKVVPGSPAEKAGLQPGDVLFALNGVRLLEQNNDAIYKARKGWKPGQCVTYTIRRAGVDQDITLTLDPMPADIMAGWIGQHMRDHADAERAAVKVK